jgi:6-phospho-beta-glucosidase
MLKADVKVALLGGSSVATPELINALRRQPSPDVKVNLVLHGRTPDKLLPVSRAAEHLAQGCEWLKVSATNQLDEALVGADYVINQIRVGGLSARAFDETFPIPFGIPGEETVGPGGFANAMRTIPEAVRLAQAVEKYAPNALLLSFTNPASVVQYAVARTSNIRVIGLCDAPITMLNWVAQALKCSPAELSVDYVGMHHYGFITRVMRDSADVTDAMLTGLASVPSIDVDLDIIHSLRALPGPYFKYFFHADRILEKQRQQKHSRAEQLQQVEAELLAEYRASQSNNLNKRAAKWYDAIIAPVLMALIQHKPTSFILNVTNGTTHPWLPVDAIIETPCLLEQGRARAISVPLPNREIIARIQRNCAYEQLMVEAVLEQSQEKALRALLLNELVPNMSVARALLQQIHTQANDVRLTS